MTDSQKALPDGEKPLRQEEIDFLLRDDSAVRGNHEVQLSQVETEILEAWEAAKKLTGEGKTQAEALKHFVDHYPPDRAFVDGSDLGGQQAYSEADEKTLPKWSDLSEAMQVLSRQEFTSKPKRIAGGPSVCSDRKGRLYINLAPTSGFDAARGLIVQAQEIKGIQLRPSLAEFLAMQEAYAKMTKVTRASRTRPSDKCSSPAGQNEQMRKSHGLENK